MNREDYIKNIAAKLRVLFPDAVPYAEEKRSEILSSVAGEILAPPLIADLASAADLPIADLKKLWRTVEAIVDAH